MNRKIKNKKIIAIIPARGGSKGIPRKNVKLLAGKPMIAYTVEAALKSKYLDRVIVSTEDKEIAETSKKYGVEVIKRPKRLATDKAGLTDVISHVLDILRRENYIPKLIILLQPTSPLRNTDDINRATELFLKDKAEFLISVCPAEHPPCWGFMIKNKYLKPIFEPKYLEMTRQDLPKSYMPNGAIYIFAPEVLSKYKSFHSNKTLPYIMPPERSVDIDNEMDFMLAELIINKDK